MDDTRHSKHLRVTVSALTRQRPNMLAELLRSFSEMVVPEGTDVRILIVENDVQDISRATVESLSPLPNGLVIDYVLETEPGIPFGRNRAAKEALAAGHDLLLFVDDDEVVAKDWLVRFVEGYRNSNAMLMGAPLRIAPPSSGLSRLERLMHRSLAARYERKENRASGRATLNATPGVTVVTNNWLGETQLFANYDLWFDENMRFTGGTDAKFHADARAKGLPTGWVSDAYVYETIPTDRLSFGYQFRRGRDQSNSYFHRKMEKSPWARLSVVVGVPAKLTGALLLTLALPFNEGRGLIDIARSLGWIAGHLSALFGRKSSLYTETTGD